MVPEDTVEDPIVRTPERPTERLCNKKAEKEASASQQHDFFLSTRRGYPSKEK